VDLTGGHLLTPIYRALGGAPSYLVSRVFRATGISKEITKPLAILKNLDDRDYLAQIEAVDHFMDNMIAYPGRTFGQLYHRLFRANDLREGHLDLGGRRLELADVRVPVLVIAGAGDSIAPQRAVHRLTELLVHAPEVVYRVAPGGHLGVLTGRGARATTWAHVDGFLAGHDRVPPPRRRAGKAPAHALITERALPPGRGMTHGRTDGGGAPEPVRPARRRAASPDAPVELG
jgi:polyhydroxyalkanoate synthase